MDFIQFIVYALLSENITGLAPPKFLQSFLHDALHTGVRERSQELISIKYSLYIYQKYMINW